MRVEQAERILRRIQKRYDKNPEEEWRVLMGRDASGRLTQIIGDSSDSWQIKGELVTPTRYAGVGLQLKGLGSGDLLDLAEPYYGIRPVGKGILRDLLDAGPAAALRDLAVLPRTPLKEALEAEALVEGPILHSGSPISPISEGQRQLDLLLNRGLEKLMRRKFPETRYAYG